MPDKESHHDHNKKPATPDDEGQSNEVAEPASAEAPNQASELPFVVAAILGFVASVVLGFSAVWVVAVTNYGAAMLIPILILIGLCLNMGRGFSVGALIGLGLTFLPLGLCFMSKR